MYMTFDVAMAITHKNLARTPSEQEAVAAVSRIRYAAESERNLSAMLRLSLLHERGDLVDQNLSLMVKHAAMGCDLNDEYCMLKMGHSFLAGNGVKSSVSDGVRWYDKAAALGNATAAYRSKEIRAMVDLVTRSGFNLIPEALNAAECGNACAMLLASAAHRRKLARR